MEKLPTELITANILSRLPTVSQLQCRKVCNNLRTLIPKPKIGLLYRVSHRKAAGLFEAEFYFSEQINDKVSSTNHADYDEQRVSSLGTLKKMDHCFTMQVNEGTFMVGSCNGLVCYTSIASYPSRKVYICNPLTGEDIQVPNIECYADAVPTPLIGFGCSRSSNKYKVVRILLDRDRRWWETILLGRDRRCRWKTIQVYTLQGGSVWRDKCIIEYCLSSHDLSHISASAGVFASGALHWIVWQSLTLKVVAFDLEHETFEFLQSPPSVGKGTDNIALLVLGGGLCVLEMVSRKHVTIWESSYTQEHHEHTWVKKFDITLEDHSWLHPFVSINWKTFFLSWYNAVLTCYDLETNTLMKVDETLKTFMDDSRKISIHTSTRAVPYMNSVVSLKAIMEERVGNKRKTHTRKRGSKQKKRNMLHVEDLVSS